MVRLGGLPTAAFVLLLLLSTNAIAASAGGTFYVEGSAVLPSDSSLSFSPLAVFVNDTRGVSAWRITAASVIVHVYEREAAEAPNGALPVVLEGEPSHAQHVVTGAVVTLAEGDATGKLGFYPARSAGATHVFTGAPLVERKERTTIATATGPIDEDAFASGKHYLRTLDEPHLLWEEPGALTYAGDGLVKVLGLDLHVAGDGLDRTFSTGYEPREELLVRTFTYRWLVLELHDAQLEAASALPWLVAATSAEARWQGRAFFEGVSGELSTGESRYEATSQTISVDGAFDGRFTIPPAPEGYGLRLTLEGNLRSTDLAAQSLPVATRIANGSFFDAPLLLALGFAGVIAGGGYAAGAWRASRRRPDAPAPLLVAAPPAPVASHLPFTAEDCCDAGAKAASEEDWAAAAKWFARAHQLAPTSARICADLAFSLAQIGDLDQALVLYAQASHLSADGEADFNAALATLHADRPFEEVEQWLERALDRSPALVLTLDGDNDFRALEGRPRYEAAIGRAWEALERAEGA